MHSLFRQIKKTYGMAHPHERKTVLRNFASLSVLQAITYLLPVIVLPFWFMSIVTAPAALYITVRYWNAPPSIVSPGKARFLIAFVLALCQVAAWGLFVTLYLMNRSDL